MGAKPSSLPRWADVGGAIVVPSSGKLDVGWVAAERPPAQYLNWYQNLVYLWVVWISSYFTNGGAATGQTDLGHVAEATVTPTSVWRDYAQKIRTVIDHNGYRMGQLSEIDENWASGPQTVKVPLVAAHMLIAGFTINANGQIKIASTGTGAMIPLSGVVPPGAFITSILVSYVRTTAGDSFNFNVERASNGLGDTTAASYTSTTTVSSGTGAGSVDLCAAGKAFFLSSTTGNNFIRVTSTAVTTADWIVDVTVTYQALPANWSSTFTSFTTTLPADRIDFTDPDANINHRSLKVTGKSDAASAFAGNMELFGPFECFHDANCAYVMEFMLRTGAITGGAANRILAAGIQNSNAAALNRFVYFYNENAVANWQLRVVGSATADTDTGVVLAANTTYRMRLEIYGSSVHTSGNTKIRAYINGTKVAEVNVSTLPTADMIRPYFKAGTTSTVNGGPFDFRIGRLARRWNHLLTSDNL